MSKIIESKRIKKNVSSFTIAFIFFVVIILTIFGGINKTTYQQDEWLGYGLYLAQGKDFILINTPDLFSLILGEGRVLYSSLLYFFYKFAPLDVFSIVILALILHALNALIVFYLAKRVVKNNTPAFLGTTLFLANSVSQSAITWPAASLNTLPSTTLILLSVFLYFRYLDTFKSRLIILSFAAAYVSLFFKESGIFLFLLLPFFLFVYKRQSISTFIKRYWYFFLTTTLIVFYRIYSFRQTDQVALFLTDSSKYYLDSLVARSILYPLTSFSLSIIPPDFSLNFARHVTNVYYPFFPPEQFTLIAQTTVLDLIAVILSFAIGIILVVLLRAWPNKIVMEIKFWIAFIVASFLPYVIISKSYSYLESRYYYVASVAWGVIFAWILALILKTKIKFISLLGVILYLFFLFSHKANINAQINQTADISQTRIKMISDVKRLKPNIEKDRNVFYITGNSDYYLPGNRIPFQHGFGYTLMALYYRDNKIPTNFLKDHFLFDIGSQGYKEENGNGFGYFTDLSLLNEAVNKYKIPKDSVYPFYYDSKTKVLLQIDF